MVADRLDRLNVPKFRQRKLLSKYLKERGY